MSRRDDLHFPVRRALEKEGWTITHDPLAVYLCDTRLKVDVGAERRFAATHEGRKIAVEVKDFDSESLTNELQKMMGQMLLYQWGLDEAEPDRKLFLALNKAVYDEHLRDQPLTLFNLIVERLGLSLIVFDQQREVILQWINN
ncbi:MAG: element excision factor XisH family protein [Blastocatellia bacterium]